MGQLIDAIRTKDSLTENGMVTNSTSLNDCVDLFFQIGAMRGADKQRLINSFVKAFENDALTAMRLLFWSRDIRGGAGERQIFRDIIEYLAKSRTETLRKNLFLISEYGRWDDYLILLGTPLEADVLEIIAKGLGDKNALCAKWLPRPNTKNVIGKMQSSIIRKYLKLSPREYRKLLVENSNTVEQLMCSGRWSEIDYEKLPSKAMSDLMKAFSKNDLTRFQEYLGKLEKGEVKINASAIYPYDVITSLNQGNIQGANLQWDALPNFMLDNTERLLPVVDVSGSMSVKAGESGTLSCMDVAISLGLYISERNEGAFKDAFITFSERPKLQVLRGNLHERYNQLKRAEWGMSTALNLVFDLVLEKAIQNNVSPDEMPTMILILSDMEFNRAIKNTASEMITQKYNDSGYELPKIVFWNLNSRNSGNVPVQYDEEGKFLVSGFSPSILKTILSGKSTTPLEMMLEVTESERYKSVTI